MFKSELDSLYHQEQVRDYLRKAERDFEILLVCHARSDRSTIVGFVKTSANSRRIDFQTAFWRLFMRLSNAAPIC